MNTWILVATLAVALMTASACSQEQRDDARQDAKTAGEGLENAARDGAAAQSVEELNAAIQRAEADMKKEGAMKSARAAEEDVEGRVENSGEIAEETYDESREKGEGQVEATGDAYDAVEEAGK